MPYKLNRNIEWVVDDITGAVVGQQLNLGNVAYNTAVAIPTSALMPDLQLDFTTTAIDPRVTYTRTKSATRTNAAGQLAFAPENVIARSNSFSYWTANNVIVSPALATDGNVLLSETTATGQHAISTTYNATVQGQPVTVSAYVHSGGLAGRSKSFRLQARAADATTLFYVDVALDFGVVTGSYAGQTRVTDAGDGWWRIELTYSETAGPAPRVLYLMLGAGASYPGDARVGVYVKNAQVESGTLAGPVVQTQASAVYLPRIDYSATTIGSVLGALIEEARTNLCLNSNVGATQTVTVTATTYTVSFYGTGAVTLSNTGSGTFAGTVVSGTDVYPARVQFSFLAAAGSLTLTIGGTVSFVQLEAGAHMTSYIPSYAVAASRSAESYAIPASYASTWYSTDVGTVAVEFTVDSKASANGVFLSFGGGADMWMWLKSGDAGYVRGGTLDNGPDQYYLGTLNSNKAVCSQGPTGVYLCQNGLTVQSTATVSTGHNGALTAYIGSSDATTGHINGRLKWFNYFKTQYIYGSELYYLSKTVVWVAKTKGQGEVTEPFVESLL